MSGIARLVLACCLLAIAAAAVQPVYRVAADVIYLPNDGLALDAQTGHLLWRFPRQDDAQVYTNGQGLLLVSWIEEMHHPLHVTFTRMCRLDTQDGRQLWCRTWSDVRQWTVDSGGRTWYLHTRGRLEVVGTADGHTEFSLKIAHDDGLQLLPLPQEGALLFNRRGDQAAQALVYHPGGTALEAEALPAGVYPFRGDGRGLIFYARQQGAFYRADPVRLVAPAAAAAASARPFPEASLDEHGFLFTGWQGAQPVLRGGTYGGSAWDAPRPAAQLRLAVIATTAVMLAALPASTRITAWALADGAPRFSRTLPGHYADVNGQGDDLVLQSDQDVRLLDAASGAQRWRLAGHEGPLAAISATAVIFWEAGGKLAALARSNGALLWRLRFQLPHPGRP